MPSAKRGKAAHISKRGKAARANVIALTIAALLAAGPAQPAFADESHSFHIAAADASTAVREFAHQSGVQIMASADALKDKTLNPVAGEHTTEAALNILLADTGLRHEYVDDRGVVIAPTAQTKEARVEARPSSFWSRFRLAQTDKPSPSQGEGQSEDRQQAAGDQGVEDPAQSQKRIELEEILVTGTHIRGAKVPSPVLTITQEQMRLSGHTNLGEVIRSLPQNFGGGQNPGVATGASGRQANINVAGASSLNLRGLGPDATLTLLNGTRLPYDSFSHATDVSVIPIAAIERMEVLLDGASAIYGSDAVAGVANIILKRDYQGAELAVRGGVATEGGYTQTQYTGVAGTTWSSGGFLVTADAARSTAIRPEDRDYLSYMPNQRDATVYPSLTQSGMLFSGHQDLSNFAELALDAFYTEREQSTFDYTTSILTGLTDSTIYGFAPAVRFELPNTWSLRVHGAVGQDEIELHRRFFSIATGAQTLRADRGTLNRANAAGVEAEGSLFALPGGEARISLGGGYRKNEYQQRDLDTGVKSTAIADRSRYFYGEINLPMISSDQGIPLVTALSFNGAVRHERYDSFGDTTTPKVGVVWSATPAIDLKASWGKSFKVPNLNQQDDRNTLALVSGSLFPGAPAGSTIMYTVGGSSDLEPERAVTVTAGFVIQPQSLPDFSLEANWFDIDYTDRIVSPITPVTQGLINPAYAPFVTLNPTSAHQAAVIAAASQFFNQSGGAYNPATVYAILQNRYANTVAERASGVDLTAHYGMAAYGGRLSLSGGASWMDGERQLTELAPELPIAGVIWYPAKFKGRLGASWSRDGFTLASTVYHIGGVENTNLTPPSKGDSMTTLDFAIDYEMYNDLLGDMRFNIAVTNAFDQRPPFLQPASLFLVNFDSTNYSAIGRVVSATVTKKF